MGFRAGPPAIHLPNVTAAESLKLFTAAFKHLQRDERDWGPYPDFMFPTPLAVPQSFLDLRMEVASTRKMLS